MKKHIASRTVAALALGAGGYGQEQLVMSSGLDKPFLRRINQGCKKWNKKTRLGIECSIRVRHQIYEAGAAKIVRTARKPELSAGNFAIERQVMARPSRPPTFDSDQPLDADWRQKTQHCAKPILALTTT